MDFVVAFALQKKVPELKNDKRQMACVKWVVCRGDQQKLTIWSVIFELLFFD